MYLYIISKSTRHYWTKRYLTMLFSLLSRRYRSITKQFFRKADGVVVIYDVTMHDSFRSVRPWLSSIQEAVGDPIPIMLLGNKSDKESMREVSTKEGKRLSEVKGSNHNIYL